MLFLVFACCCDYWKGKIPNLLLVIIFLFGLGHHIIQKDMAGLILFMTVVFTVMLLLYPLFKIGVIGAGDVKLYGVCAGYLPCEKILLFLFLSLLIAAIISVFKMIKESNAVERIHYFCDYLFSVISTGKIGLYPENEQEKKKASICLAGPILGSILLYMGGFY